ncbi:MAG: TrwC relaxase [Pseudonocardiales bacterium]|nr:MAG: TrwC relaxase [Pseudonocardiales bacterium]
MKTYRGSAVAARNYVEADRGRADDYYLVEGNGVAERYVASPTFGVHPAEPLTGDEYEAWVAGIDPTTGVPRGRLRHDKKAVRFVEVTVNGPKSWSLAAELHPAISRALDAAQDRAATQIIAWIAEHATTRVGPRGAQVQVPVQHIEAVTVRHYTSRAGDPHRHLHLQINARVLAEGAWRGLHTVGVRDSLDAINGIGHAAVLTDPQFRAALTAHGFTINEDGEVTQLAEFVGSFSARAAQIGRNIDRYETEWLAANPGRQPDPALRRSWDARAWAEDRPDKVVPESGDALRRRWVEELHALGYRDRVKFVKRDAAQIGAIDRERCVAIVLSRLATRRSGWNAADIRGEVEQLIARCEVVADAAVRTELAEDLTARSVADCVPLLARIGAPEHVRALTSRHVLDVETDLAGRFAARANAPDMPAQWRTETHADRLDAAQRNVVAALAGDRQLVIVEGAAGAGKTTTLAAARAALEELGQRLTVVTPTRKAARIAADQLGSAASSAAWLVHQHGYRWDENGVWTRLQAGDVDPFTGTRYDGCGEQAQLRRGDLLLVDEAGMLDQDTARALLTIADEHRTRVALVGDRHQLSAVGRGGVLDLAARWADPEACLTLDTVHRFTRNITTPQGATKTVADTEYADLSLAMRAGDDPSGVFDALVARGQVRIHNDDGARTRALAEVAAASLVTRFPTAVVADTRDEVAELNAAVRDRLIAVGRVDDGGTTSGTGQRIGAGDRIATRHNDRDLDVANRDVWTIVDVGWHGGIVVSGEHGQRTLPPEYVRRHVELAYASTVYGVQGDTAMTAHIAIGEHTGASSAYVGMTRGRQANTAHLVAADLDEAREQWVAVFARDRADLGPAHAAAQAEREASRYAIHRPLEQVTADLHQAWSVEAELVELLARNEDWAGALREIVTLRHEQQRQLPMLDTARRRARDAGQLATERADAAEAHVADDTSTLRDTLIDQWASQRENARADAATVRSGAGRLGLQRGDVTRASARLTEWANAWQVYLPTLPTGGEPLLHAASRPDNHHDVFVALDAAARSQAERAHPEHAVAFAASRDATEQQRQAASAHTRTQRYYDQTLYHYGELAHIDNPAGHLRELESDITAITEKLQSAQSDIVHLMGDPAVRSRPSTWLELESARWRHDYDAQVAVSSDVPTDPYDHRLDDSTAWPQDTHEQEHEPDFSR